MPPTLLFDRSAARARFTVRGAAAVQTLNGLVTNDLAALRPGEGCYAAALTAKGRLVADVRVLALQDGSLWVDTGERAAGGLRELLGKYVNPRFAQTGDITEETGALVVSGPAARAIVSAVAGLDEDQLAALPHYGHHPASWASAAITVLRVAPLHGDATERDGTPDQGTAEADAATDAGPAATRAHDEAYELIGARDRIDALADALVAAGATRADDATWDQLRIARGAPEWGVEMDETMLPQEANLDERGAISYTKGCYIGQETVARIHFRGHVNRTLRRVLFPGDALPPRGAALLGDGGASIGDLRSVTRVGPPGGVGIAMVRHEVPDGATVEARWEGGTAHVLVVDKAKGAID